jgi:hypothetical protein
LRFEIWIFYKGQPGCDDDRSIFFSDDVNLGAT